VKILLLCQSFVLLAASQVLADAGPPQNFWVYYRQFDRGPQKLARFGKGFLTANEGTQKVPTLTLRLEPDDKTPPSRGEWAMLDGADYQAAVLCVGDGQLELVQPTSKPQFQPIQPPPATGPATPPSLEVTFSPQSQCTNKAFRFEIYVTFSRANPDSNVTPPPGRTNLKLAGKVKWTVDEHGKVTQPKIERLVFDQYLLDSGKPYFPRCITGCPRPAAFVKQGLHVDNSTIFRCGSCQPSANP
jgi:hypothetical protein